MIMVVGIKLEKDRSVPEVPVRSTDRLRLKPATTVQLGSLRIGFTKLADGEWRMRVPRTKLGRVHPSSPTPQSLLGTAPLLHRYDLHGALDLRLLVQVLPSSRLVKLTARLSLFPACCLLEPVRLARWLKHGTWLPRSVGLS